MRPDLPFELFVAIRYLLARRKQAFISLISFISIIGVAVGVMALLIALALMTGLQGELRDRLVGSAAHVYVQKVGGIHDAEAEMQRLLTVPRVTGAAPVAIGKGMISAGSDKADVLSIKGVVPERERTPLELLRTIAASCYVVDDDLMIGLRWIVEDVTVVDSGDPMKELARAYLDASSYSPVQHDLERGRSSTFTGK